MVWSLRRLSGNVVLGLLAQTLQQALDSLRNRRCMFRGGMMASFHDASWSTGDLSPMRKITAAAAALDAAKRGGVDATVWQAEQDLQDAVRATPGPGFWQSVGHAV